MLTQKSTGGRFISILADGNFHETVNPNTEGAILREYETKDGTKGSKWELIYEKIDAEITDVKFKDGDYGEQILVTFSDGDNDVILAQGVGSNFGEDIMKKLPNIDLSKKLTVSPYSFTDENGKEKKGVTFYQDGKKIEGFFYDTEKKAPKNGYPTPDGDVNTFKSDDWKLFYLIARKFLVNYTKENICTKFADKPVASRTEAPTDPLAHHFEYPENDINPEDIPF